MADYPNTFTAFRVTAEGKSTHGAFEQIALDALTAGNVIIKVLYSSINYKDALAVTGKGRILKGSPRTPGIDLAGIVVESLDASIKVGDQVLVTGCNIGEALDGGYSQYARLPAEAIVPLPTGLSLEEAMALGTAGFTAALAVRRMLENHQTPSMGNILVSGATGGVGSVALSILKAEGFSTAALTGKPEQAAYLHALGADEIVDRNVLVMGAKPLEAATWGGAIDNLGGETLNWLTRTVKPWGNIASVGLAQDFAINSTVMPFILRGVSLLGIHSVECPRAWRLAIWQRLASDWKPKNLMQSIRSQTIDLDQMPAVCEDIIAGKIVGRTVVKVASA